MALNLANASAALKDIYLPVIREQLNSKVMFLQQIENNTEDVEGNQVVLSLHVSRNSGVGARGDGGTLPTAGSQGYVKETVQIHHLYGRIQVTGPTIRAMKSDRGSFTRAVESESKGLVTDLRRDVNRQLFGTSNGVIATAGTTTTSNTVVLLNPTEVQLRQIEQNAVVDIGTLTSPTSVASARTVTAVDTVNGTITISGATVSTTSGAAFIFRSGSGGQGANQLEVTGLQTIVKDSGTLFNVDPSIYPVWKSTVEANGGTLRAATDSLFEVALDEIDIASGEYPNLIIATHGVIRNYAAQLKDQKRFVGDPLTLKGGFKAVTIDTPDGSLPLAKDRDNPGNTAFILNTDHLKWNTQSDWEWMDEDGAVLSRVPNTDAYEATLYQDAELTTDMRNAHGVIVDLLETS